MSDAQAAQVLEHGKSYQLAGRFRQAEQCYQQVLRERPSHPEALNLMGTIAIESGAYDAAIGLMKKAIHARPKNASFRNNLGYALLLNSEPEAALVHLRKALATDPLKLDALLNAAYANQMLGRAEEAARLYRKATGLYPDHLRASLGLAETLLELGQDHDALSLLRRIVERDPNNPEALQILAKGHRFRPGEAEVTLVEAQLRNEAIPEKSRSIIHWVAGKMYADLGRYDEAFEYFERSKSYKGTRFDLSSYRRFVDRSIQLFTADFFRDRGHLGNESELPIFVVGMPRSGTTLVEQILASHPNVATGGELDELEKSVRILTARTAYHDDAFFRQVKELSSHAVAGEAARYLAALKRVSSSARRVTDKMPHNFQFLGLIAVLYPNARVIHCRRNALDTCMSCYTHRFTEAHSYNNDLATLGLYYREYARLMEHWSSALPIRLHQFRYEDLIADQATETRRLLNFVGLSWDDACLDFHRTKGSVRTPSQQQVRQPLYSSAIGQWRRYEAHIGPLRDALGDLAEP